MIRQATKRVTLPVRTTGWQRLRSAAAAIAGALTLVGGLTRPRLDLHCPYQVIDITVSTVFAADGPVLVVPHRIRLPGPLTAASTAGCPERTGHGDRGGRRPAALPEAAAAERRTLSVV
jgi:hypothetical protein